MATSLQCKLFAAYNKFKPVSVTLESGVTIDGHVYGLTPTRFYMADRLDQDWELNRKDIVSIEPYDFATPTVSAGTKAFA